MSYELSDKMILKGELMKYRRSLCDSVGERGKGCESCPVLIKAISRCAVGIVIKSLEHKSNSFN
jgi:hypothetical protein